MKYERTQYDWSPLDHWCDPIPGSPATLESQVTFYRQGAENLQLASSNLRNLCNRNETRSEAVEKIMAKAEAAAVTLSHASDRHSEIAAALSGYVPELRAAQSVSLDALNRATEAASKENRARSLNQDARSRTQSVDQVARDQAVLDYNKSLGDVSLARGDIADAKAQLAQAIAQRDSAAEAAAAAVHQSIDTSVLNDTGADWGAAAWKTVSAFVGAVGTWIWDNIDTISLVLDAISLVLTLSGVGAPFAAVLQVVKTVVKVVSLAKKAYGLGADIAIAERTGNWWPVALSSGVLAADVVMMPLAARWVNGKSGLAVVKGALVEKAVAQAVYAPTNGWANIGTNVVKRIALQNSTNFLGDAIMLTHDVRMTAAESLLELAVDISLVNPDLNHFTVKVCPQ